MILKKFKGFDIDKILKLPMPKFYLLLDLITRELDIQETHRKRNKKKGK